ncbi:ABC transporter ATP-binding protein [Curtobacterium sp. MCLR17_032]|uniref:ABC transporter ATP-binding protein n=1 Tax=Curtobacterium sp. MCLR17_032 TaxID=2175650 RepID=UPI000DAA9334|nr:ABC transporter ATP-binding protein [Curtobacterium sp. MCLR17_032]WIE61386.1 ABC transporter ATP-binding protein [Curtobacterium sp. MCLR17_032]
MSTMALLELDAVAVQYGSGAQAVTALAGVDLTIRPGEMVAVMGTSGSGKSTLLSVAGTLMPPTSGEVRIDGEWVSDRPARELAALRRRVLGFVFQDFNLIPSLTAVENVALPLELDGWRTGRARKAAELALESVELGHRLDAWPDDLSGGQRQRVAIARGVVGDRKLVLADEPTGALDSQTGEVVLRMLRRHVDSGAGALLVTHDARHAAWADRIVFLRDGRIVDETVYAGVELALTDAQDHP